MSDVRDLPGIDRAELAKALKAGVRGPLFYRVTIETIGLDAGAIQRERGLTMMLGGSSDLAAAFSPDTHLARVIDKSTHFVSLDDASALPILEIGARDNG
jgi:hypothetical protein